MYVRGTLFTRVFVGLGSSRVTALSSWGFQKYFEISRGLDKKNSREEGGRSLLRYRMQRDPRTFGTVMAFSLRFWYGPPLLVRSFCPFGTVICALLVRSRKRDKATCAFGVVMCGYGKVMDLTKTEMTVPKPNKGRKTAKKGGALLVRSFFILCF